MRAGPDHLFGLSATAIALGGKYIQMQDIHVTGNEAVDYAIQNNLDSVLGMVMYAYIFDLIADKKATSTQLTLFSLAVVLLREGLIDPFHYGGGVDYTDLFGGMTASSAYFYVASRKAPKQ
jgi:hypothetical protein